MKYVIRYARIPTNYNPSQNAVVEAASPEDALAILRDNLGEGNGVHEYSIGRPEALHAAAGRPHHLAEREGRMSDTTTRAKAEQMWDAFTANERVGVRFGMFPAAPMAAVEQEGLWNMHELTCALMDVASSKGGMKA